MSPRRSTGRPLFCRHRRALLRSHLLRRFRLRLRLFLCFEISVQCYNALGSPSPPLTPPLTPAGFVGGPQLLLDGTGAPTGFAGQESDRDGRPPLVYAAERGAVAAVKDLLRLGATVGASEALQVRVVSCCLVLWRRLDLRAG